MCVSVYVHALYISHIVQDSVISVSAGLQERTNHSKLQGWFWSSYRHMSHLNIKTFDDYLRLPVNSTLMI